MYLHITVRPGTKKELFEKTKSETYVVSVKEEAKENAANTRVLELLALHLRVPKNKLRMRTGHRGRKKVIEVLE
jgi:uncharacterized protein YggU (UPF0235/DUF167 family)